MDTIRIFTRCDQREAVGLHVFMQSVIETCSLPVAFTPITQDFCKLAGGQRDGTTSFSFARFLVPALCDFRGWALWCDGVDMLARGDLAEIWQHIWEYDSLRLAARVCKHDYATRHPVKFKGTEMEAANPAKARHNWSSLILWNCAALQNRVLTPDFIRKASGSELHQFRWLDECPERLGELPLEWNWLVGEYEPRRDARLVHFTLGIPGFEHYRDADYAAEWWDTHERAERGMQIEGGANRQILAKAVRLREAMR